MRIARFSFLPLVLLVFAACGVETPDQAMGSPTPTPDVSPTGPTPTPTPAGVRTFTVNPKEIYLYDDSEPFLTEPGECYFGFDVNGVYAETSEITCADGATYPLTLPAVHLEVAAGGKISVAAVGGESDPTGFDDLGGFAVDFASAEGFGVGSHIELALFAGGAIGNFDLTFDITEP